MSADQYELMLLTRGDLEEAARTSIVEKITEQVTTGGGTFVKLDEWGRRKLAYEIEKQTEAIYQLVHVDCPPAALEDVLRILRITDGVLRAQAVIRVPEYPEGAKLEELTDDDLAERASRPQGRGGRGGRGGGGGGRGGPRGGDRD
jgi:small subunit ribosomal protein S6